MIMKKERHSRKKVFLEFNKCFIKTKQKIRNFQLFEQVYN